MSSKQILLIVLLALWPGCATAVPERASASVENLAPDALLVSLSSEKVFDASIAIVRLQLGSSWLKDPELESKVKGTFDGLNFPFYPASPEQPGVFEAVLGIPYLYEPGTKKIEVTIGKGPNARKISTVFAVANKDYPSETLTVDPNKVNPPKSAISRILAEKKEIGQIYRTITRKKFWTGPFKMPLESSPTSVFGTKRVYNGTLASPHLGLDLRAQEGTPIAAASAGKVVLAKDLYFSGNTVILDHGYGVFTIYAHLSQISVAKEQVVFENELLGLSGMTGRVSGPHLHWGATIHGIKVYPVDLTQVMK